MIGNPHSTAPRLPQAPRSVLVGLIGQGVRPSLTPPLHELEGARHGMSYVYRPVDIAPDDAAPDRLEQLLWAARTMGFDGLNVTHPAKQAVIPLLDDLAPSARRVGAVNTVKFTPSGLIGHNTDVTGFGSAFDDAFGGAGHGLVIVYGAGGAGNAVATALAERDVEEIVIVDAVVDRAQELADRVCAGGREARGVGLDAADALLPCAVGVVNATPFGMAAHPGMAFDPGLLPGDAWVSDIVYRPTETALLRAARARGLRTMSGLGMVAGQAGDSFEIFTGAAADRAAIIRDIHDLVAAEAAENTQQETPR
ncbi:MAG: shikimate dehydrogenase [Microbacterium sp.]